MRTILLITLLVLQGISETITNSETELTIGVYNTFAAFIANQPSISDSSFILETDAKLTNPNDTTYSLMYEKRGRIRFYSENLWGYSDGINFYIAVGGNAVSNQKLRKMTIREFYSIYSEPFAVPSMASGGKMSDPDIIKFTLNAIEMKSGKKIVLTKPTAREIFRTEDTPLYQEFLADKHATDRISDYMEMLNKRMVQKKKQ